MYVDGGFAQVVDNVVSVLTKIRTVPASGSSECQHVSVGGGCGRQGHRQLIGRLT